MISGFPINLLAYLSSPKDGSSLSLAKGEVSTSGHVYSGEVTDTGGTLYPIQNGILRLLDTTQLTPIEYQEREQRDSEAQRYNARLRAREYREVRPFLRRLAPTSQDVVLELASGTGRVTSMLAGKTKSLIATDFSFNSLAEAAEQLPPLAPVGLVEADSVSFPGSSEAFSLILSAQFIEHIPTPERRAAHVANIKRMLVTGGRTFASVYHQDLRRRMSGEPSEGEHPNGIFFHYFTSIEIRQLFLKEFPKVSVQYLDLIIPGTVRLIRSERVLGALSLLGVNTPLALFAHLVVVGAVKT